MRAGVLTGLAVWSLLRASLVCHLFSEDYSKPHTKRIRGGLCRREPEPASAALDVKAEAAGGVMEWMAKFETTVPQKNCSVVFRAARSSRGVCVCVCRKTVFPVKGHFHPSSALPLSIGDTCTDRAVWVARPRQCCCTATRVRENARPPQDWRFGVNILSAIPN